MFPLIAGPLRLKTRSGDTTADVVVVASNLRIKVGYLLKTERHVGDLFFVLPIAPTTVVTSSSFVLITECSSRPRVLS